MVMKNDLELQFNVYNVFYVFLGAGKCYMCKSSYTTTPMTNAEVRQNSLISVGHYICFL